MGFHGMCDLVMIQSPEFGNGLGMDIHIRTKQRRQWSYIENAAVRIGDDILEVMGGALDLLGGFPVSFHQVNSVSRMFVVDLGADSIVVKTYKDFVEVDAALATDENFGKSRGLLGPYGTNTKLGRDGTTVFTDPNEFGQEWQVLPSEPNLFHNIDGPQAPQKCIVPEAQSLRR